MKDSTMRLSLNAVIRLLVLTITGMVVSYTTAAQDAQPVSLEEQLKAQYKLAKMSPMGDVLDPGTVLTVQKAGILGVSKKTAMICPSKYQDGDLHTPGSLCAGMVKAF